MITKEKIIEILHRHSYNVEDQAGNHLIVVDDDSWDDIAEQLTNCNKADVVGQSEELVCDHQWYIRFSEKRGSWRLCAKCSKEG